MNKQAACQTRDLKEVLLLITDGYADWEASYACAELNKPETAYRVRTMAIDKEPKTSMGGLKVLPDYELSDIPFHSKPAMLIMPGGTRWREPENEPARIVVDYCVQNNIPVAAICGAATFLGMYGFLNKIDHTGNSLAALREGAPDYAGEAYYSEAQSVSAGNFITANGSGAVEFAKHILEKLRVYEGEELEEWYRIFKKGYHPK